MIPRIDFDSENSFDKTIDFDIEVAEDDEIQFQGIGKEAIGGDGKNSQYTLQYIAEVIDLVFSWMEQDIYEKLIFWNINFALKGDTFRYYPDGTDTDRFYDCILTGNNKKFDPKRAHPKLVNFKVKFKARIIAVSAQVATDRAGFFP